MTLKASLYEPGNWAGPVGVHMGNLIPVAEMKIVQKAPKIPVEPRSDLSATLQVMRKYKMFRHGQFRYPSWSVHMGKISSSVTEISVAKTDISVTGPARLLI